MSMIIWIDINSFLLTLITIRILKRLTSEEVGGFSFNFIFSLVMIIISIIVIGNLPTNYYSSFIEEYGLIELSIAVFYGIIFAIMIELFISIIYRSFFRNKDIIKKEKKLKEYCKPQQKFSYTIKKTKENIGINVEKLNTNCTYCGTELENKPNFCPYCGKLRDKKIDFDDFMKPIQQNKGGES